MDDKKVFVGYTKTLSILKDSSPLTRDAEEIQTLLHREIGADSSTVEVILDDLEGENLVEAGDNRPVDVDNAYDFDYKITQEGAEVLVSEPEQRFQELDERLGSPYEDLYEFIDECYHLIR